MKQQLTMGDQTRTLNAWAALYGIKPVVVRRRIARGWAPADAVTSPVRGVAVRLVVAS